MDTTSPQPGYVFLTSRAQLAAELELSQSIAANWQKKFVTLEEHHKEMKKNLNRNSAYTRKLREANEALEVRNKNLMRDLLIVLVTKRIVKRIVEKVKVAFGIAKTWCQNLKKKVESIADFKKKIAKKVLIFIATWIVIFKIFYNGNADAPKIEVIKTPIDVFVSDKLFQCKFLF